MKIAIVGTGGVGGYFGGKLAQYYANKKDVQITFIARGKHLKAIQNSGLKVMAEKGTFIAVPDKAIDNPAPFGRFDVIIFCVKSYDLEDSASRFSQIYTDNIVILQFKNLDNLCSPARSCLAWQAGLCPKKEIPTLSSLTAS